MWASARSTVICNTGDELASETHTNKIINAGSITHKFIYTKTGSNYGFKTGTTGSKRELRVQNGIRLLQVMLQLRINNLDIKQSL